MKKTYRVLIVEDSRILRLSLEEILSEEYEVITAVDGKEALAAARQHLPDIILLDLMLPLPLDGFSLVRLFKNNLETAVIPIIIMSALSSEDKIMEGLELGANDYLVKPFKSKELVLKIRNITDLMYKRNLKNEIEKNFGSLPANPKLQVDEIDNSFELIVERLAKDSHMSIPEIARKLSVSVSRLERLIKNKYKVTPKQYITNVKLQKAEILLRRRNSTVKEISYQLGFNSVAYFCQCFKKKYGKPPKMYSADFI
ncbi:MAG TPA: response regulator [Sediminibacterium sp.]|nr:response regulator [Sediminibacterium sp.]